MKFGLPSKRSTGGKPSFAETAPASSFAHINKQTFYPEGTWTKKSCESQSQYLAKVQGVATLLYCCIFFALANQANQHMNPQPQQPTKSVVHPPLTLIIPAHEASSFIEGMMEMLQNQTFTNLHLIFSLEPDPDAIITKAAVRKHFQGDNYKHFQSLQIYQQSKRLYYQENMNFLLSKVNTDFYSYVQCDDFLLINYFEELVQCLETNPKATNCYPEAVTMVNTNSRKVFMGSSVGPIHERVEKVALGMLFDWNHLQRSSF